MSRDTTRRRFVAGFGLAGTTALAGCTGFGTGGDDGMTDEMDDGMTDTSTEMGDDMTDTSTEMDDGMTETDGMMATTFDVRVENVATAETLDTSEGARPGLLAPVAYAVHGEDVSLFTEGETASEGLETLAEDGGPAGLVEEVSMDAKVAGAAAVPEGADEPGPIGPGGAYTFSVEAHAGQRLSLASMFVQSNDLFYAPEPAGIELFGDMEEPIDGDQTEALLLWDAGTEVNEEPGAGENQAPRQPEPDTGPSEGGVVRRIEDVDDGYDYPETDAVIRLTVTPAG